MTSSKVFSFLFILSLNFSAFAQVKNGGGGAQEWSTLQKVECRKIITRIEGNYIDLKRVMARSKISSEDILKLLLSIPESKVGKTVGDIENECRELNLKQEQVAALKEFLQSLGALNKFQSHNPKCKLSSDSEIIVVFESYFKKSHKK